MTPPGRRRPTIRDVAERAGVHPATASRALNPALPGRITEETSRRVRVAADELGYYPDRAARSLRTRRSGTVGVVVPDLTNPVLAPIVRAVEETLWDAGLACLLTDTDNRADREAVLVEELRARRCEGLIIASAGRDSRAVAELDRDGPPVVLVTREPDGSPFPFVGADDASGIGAAVAHLVQLGHRHIAHLAGPSHLSTSLRRTGAFRSTLSEHGLEPIVIEGSGFTVRAGRETCSELIERCPRVTAVVAGNDMMALGALEAMEVAGRHCPADLSLVGHNDMPFMSRVSPPLTTVSIPQHTIGRTAARMLLALRDHGVVEPDRSLIPTSLVVRESTGSLRRTVAS